MSENDSQTIERETVFVAGRSGGGDAAPQTKHLTRECPALKKARTVLERPRDVYPGDIELCKWCTGDVNRPETQDVSHYNALKAAAAEGED